MLRIEKKQLLNSESTKFYKVSGTHETSGWFILSKNMYTLSFAEMRSLSYLVYAKDSLTSCGDSYKFFFLNRKQREGFFFSLIT